MTTSQTRTRPWLMAGLGIALASALALTGCSSGASSPSDSADSRISGAISSAANGDIPKDTMVVAAVTATGAKDGEWKNGALRLTYTDGSVEDLSAHINCSAISHLIEAEDGLILIYPDGEVDCREK